jgi:hypothetical protein
MDAATVVTKDNDLILELLRRNVAVQNAMKRDVAQFRQCFDLVLAQRVKRK